MNPSIAGPAIVAVVIVAIYAMCTIVAWHIDGLAPKGRHALRELRAEREAGQFLAELHEIPVYSATATRTPDGLLIWEPLIEGAPLPTWTATRSLDDTGPLPAAVCVWGGTVQQVLDRIEAEAKS